MWHDVERVEMHMEMDTLNACPYRGRVARERSAVMATSSVAELEDVIAQYHRALDDFMRGNHEPAKAVFSERDDVSLGNPFGPFVHGFAPVVDTMAQAAAQYRDGEALGFDRIASYTDDKLVCIVEVEHLRSKVGSHEDLTELSLRVTTVFRLEEAGWKVAHRHADPISGPRPAESVLS